LEEVTEGADRFDEDRRAHRNEETDACNARIMETTGTSIQIKNGNSRSL